MPGQGKQQIEFNTDHRSQQAGSSQVGALTYTYGISDKLDFFVAQPSTWSHPSGFNDASVGSKYRFTENGSESWAVKTELLFPTGSSNKGLGGDSRDATVTLARSTHVAPWMMHSSGALTWHRYRQSADRDAQRKSVWRASTAVQYTLYEHWQLVADLGVMQAAQRQDRTYPVQLALGLIYSPNSSFDWDLGIKRSRIQGYNERQVGAGLTWHY